MHAKMIIVEVIPGKESVFHAQRTVANLPAVGDWIEMTTGSLQVTKRIWPKPFSDEDNRVYVHCRREAKPAAAKRSAK